MDNKTIKKLPSNYYENLGKILENVANKKFSSSGVKVATSSTEKDMLQEYEANVRRMKSLKRFGVNLSSTVQSSDDNAESTKKDDEENDDEEEEEEGTRNTLTSFEKQMFSHSAAASKNAEKKALEGLDNEDYEKRMVEALEAKRKKAKSKDDDGAVFRAFSREASVSKLGTEEINKELPDGTALRVFSREAPPKNSTSSISSKLSEEHEPTKEDRKDLL